MRDYGEDFNVPDTVKVDREEYYKMQEKIEYYKTTINRIAEEAGSEEEDKDKIENIKKYICQLDEVVS